MLNLRLSFSFALFLLTSSGSESFDWPLPSDIHVEHLQAGDIEELVRHSDCSYSSLVTLMAHLDDVTAAGSSQQHEMIINYITRCASILDQRLTATARQRLDGLDLTNINSISNLITDADKARLANMRSSIEVAPIIVGALKMLATRWSPLDTFYDQRLMSLVEPCRRIERALRDDALRMKFGLMHFIPEHHEGTAAMWLVNLMICEFFNHHIATEYPERFLEAVLAGSESAIEELSDIWPVALSVRAMRTEARYMLIRPIEKSILQYVGNVCAVRIRQLANQETLKREFADAILALKVQCKVLEPLDNIVWLVSAGAPYNIPPDRELRIFELAHACSTLQYVDFEELEQEWLMNYMSCLPRIS